MIYFAINEFEDLESHFDLVGVYFSEEDLLKDLEKIKRYNYSIYSAESSSFIDGYGDYLKQHSIKEFVDKMKEKEEYQEYIRLKAKFEKEIE